MGTLRSAASAETASDLPATGTAPRSSNSRRDTPPPTPEITNSAGRSTVPKAPQRFVDTRAAQHPPSAAPTNAAFAVPHSAISTSPEPAPEEPASSFQETESVCMAGTTAGQLNNHSSKESASGAVFPNVHASLGTSAVTIPRVDLDAAASATSEEEYELEQSSLATDKLGGQLTHLEDTDAHGDVASIVPTTPPTRTPARSHTQMSATPQTQAPKQHGLKRKATSDDTGYSERPKKVLMSGSSDTVSSPVLVTDPASSVTSAPTTPSVLHRRSTSSSALKKQSATPRKRRATKPWDSQTSVFKSEPPTPTFSRFAPPMYQQTPSIGAPFGISAMHPYSPVFCMACGSHAPTLHATGCPHSQINVTWPQGLHESAIIAGSSPNTEAFQQSSQTWSASNANLSSAGDVRSIAGSPAHVTARPPGDFSQVSVSNGDIRNPDVSSAQARIATAVGTDAPRASFSSSFHPQQDQATYQRSCGSAHYQSSNKPVSSIHMTESAAAQMQRGIQYLEPLLGPENSQITPHWSSQPARGASERSHCSANQLSAVSAPESAVATSSSVDVPPTHGRKSRQPSAVSSPAQEVTLGSGDVLVAENDFTSGGTAIGQDGFDPFANVELSELDLSFLNGIDWDDLSSPGVQVAEEIDSGFNNF